MIAVSPAPAADEAAAIMAAVQAVLDSERGRVAFDPLPPVYRSKWRRAAFDEGAGFVPQSSEVIRVF